MRTIIILLGVVVLIVFVVLFFFLKEENQNFLSLLKIFRKQKKEQTETHTTIDTKFFEQGLETINFHNDDLKQLKEHIHKHIIGLDGLINAIMINILCGGHVLVE